MENKVTGLEFFSSLPDDVLIEIINNDKESLNMICLCLGLELSTGDGTKTVPISLEN